MKAERKNADIIKLRFRLAREAAGFSKNEIAVKARTDVGAINKWERGTKYPSLDTVLKYCLLYNVTPNYLLGWDDYGKQEPDS